MLYNLNSVAHDYSSLHFDNILVTDVISCIATDQKLHYLHIFSPHHHVATHLCSNNSLPCSS